MLGMKEFYYGKLSLEQLEGEGDREHDKEISYKHV